MYRSIVDAAKDEGRGRISSSTSVLRPINRGGNRDVWKLQTQHDDSLFAMKTLRVDRLFDRTSLEMQQIDALVMERHTKSKRTLNMFGFCGQTSIVDFAVSDAQEELIVDMSPKKTLEVAIDMAQSVADLHRILEEDGNHLAFVHNDITPHNFVRVTPNGPLLLNDFNLVTLQCWDDEKRIPLGFDRVHKYLLRAPVWLAPEQLTEKILTEKIDVYALGAVLFYLLTKHKMYSFEDNKLTEDEIRKMIMSSTSPTLPSHITSSQSKEIQAIIHAVKLATNPRPDERPSAQEIVDFLDGTLRGQPFMFVAGLVRDVTDISQKTMDQIIELNCKYGVGVHLLVDKDPRLDELEQRRRSEEGACAPFLFIFRESVADTKNFPNRIDRISHLRDAQREHIRQHLSSVGADLKRSAVMLIDYDLAEIPSSEVLIEEFKSMQTSEQHDVICAGGRMHNPPGYYDTFATVRSKCA
jgi:serine/threonine protein kinase